MKRHIEDSSQLEYPYPNTLELRASCVNPTNQKIRNNRIRNTLQNTLSTYLNSIPARLTFLLEPTPTTLLLLDRLFLRTNAYSFLP
jgi:hypothetical protein